MKTITKLYSNYWFVCCTAFQGSNLQHEGMRSKKVEIDSVPIILKDSLLHYIARLVRSDQSFLILFKPTDLD